MKSIIITSNLIFLGAIACKQKDEQESSLEQEKYVETESQTAMSQQEESGEETNQEDEVSLHLFDDDERVIVLPEPLKLNIDGDDAPQAVLLELYSTFLDLELIETFAFALGYDLDSPNEPTEDEDDEQLNLTAAKVRPQMDNMDMIKRSNSRDLEIAKRQITSRKKYIRSFEALQDFGRKTTSVIKGKGTDYKGSYFEKAVKKKWEDANYSKFDAMKPLETSVDVGASLQRLRQLGGDKVYLGMAPSAGNLRLMREDMADNLKDGASVARFKIVSLMEDFELKFIMKNGFSFVDDTLGFLKKVRFKKGRFKRAINLETNNVKGLGVYKWRQYSTPDRTMMTTRVLDSASESVVRSMKRNKFVYVHCKSGKGRSATVVVTARAKVLIDEAKSNGIQLSRSDVETIVSEQIASVKLARDQVGISDAQKTNMLPILFERAQL